MAFLLRYHDGIWDGVWTGGFCHIGLKLTLLVFTYSTTYFGFTCQLFKISLFINITHSITVYYSRKSCFLYLCCYEYLKYGENVHDRNTGSVLVIEHDRDSGRAEDSKSA